MIRWAPPCCSWSPLKRFTASEVINIYSLSNAGFSNRAADTNRRALLRFTSRSTPLLTSRSTIPQLSPFTEPPQQAHLSWSQLTLSLGDRSCRSLTTYTLRREPRYSHRLTGSADIKSQRHSLPHNMATIQFSTPKQMWTHAASHFIRTFPSPSASSLKSP